MDSKGQRGQGRRGFTEREALDAMLMDMTKEAMGKGTPGALDDPDTHKPQRRVRPIPGMGIVSSRFPTCAGDTLLIVRARLKTIESDLSRQISLLNSISPLDDCPPIEPLISTLLASRTSLASCLARISPLTQ